MKLMNVVRIVAEDFAPDQQALISKLARPLNNFLEQIGQAMNKNIDYDNLNREQKVIQVTVDASGIPINQGNIKHSLMNRLSGIMCLQARNMTDNTFPTGNPFISYTYVGTDFSTIKLDHITGLPANKKFELTLEFVG